MVAIERFHKITYILVYVFLDIALLYLYSTIPIRTTTLPLLSKSVLQMPLAITLSIEIILKTIFVIVMLFIVNLADSYITMAFRRGWIFIIKYILLFLFLQDPVFLLIYMLTSYGALKTVQHMQPGQQRFESREGTEGSSVSKSPRDTLMLLGFLFTSIGLSAIFISLISFFIDLNTLSLLLYVLSITIATYFSREKVYAMGLLEMILYAVSIAIPPFGVVLIINDVESLIK